MDPTYPLFPIFAILGFVLVLIPPPWHLRALNSGTCLFMIWTALGCLIQFIDSIIWHNNVVDWAPVWCDISTRLTVGVAVAIPAASLCINLRLYRIASCQTATITVAQKRRAVVVDLAIGLGIPVIQMVLQYVVQGHRYDIWEDIGCSPTTVNTPLAYPLSFLWPNVISLISAIYCLLTLRAFMMHRAQFTQLVSSNSSFSINLYFRLMCLTTTEILFTIPIFSYGLYLNVVSRPICHWKSWTDTHFGFHSPGVFPAVAWRSNTLFTVNLELGRWLMVFCAFLFFGFFGFAEESRKHYRAVYRYISNRIGFVHPTNQQSSRTKKHLLPLKNTLRIFVESSNSLNLERDSLHSLAFTYYTETVRFEPDSPAPSFETFEEYERPRNIAESRFSRATI